MHTLMYQWLHTKSFGKTQPRFDKKYSGSAFLFFLLMLSVLIRFFWDDTLLHFYFPWLVKICIKDRRGMDSRAEWLNSGVFHTCCGSEQHWVNRAPHWWPVPQVIPMLRRSERWTRRHWSEIGQTLNFIMHSIFILTLRLKSVTFLFWFLVARCDWHESTCAITCKIVPQCVVI